MRITHPHKPACLGELYIIFKFPPQEKDLASLPVNHGTRKQSTRKKGRRFFAFNVRSLVWEDRSSGQRCDVRYERPWFPAAGRDEIRVKRHRRSQLSRVKKLYIVDQHVDSVAHTQMSCQQHKNVKLASCGRQDHKVLFGARIARTYASLGIGLRIVHQTGFLHRSRS